MKDRCPLCYVLDYAGLVALAASAIAIGGVRWFAATPAEPVLLEAFTWCLASTTGFFLLARLIELTRIFRRGSATRAAVPALPDNVEALPERLPRAA